MSDIPNEVLDKPPFELIFGGDVAKVLDIAYNLGEEEILEDAVVAITKLSKRELRTILVHLATLNIVKVRLLGLNSFIFRFIPNEFFRGLKKFAKEMHFELLTRMSRTG